RTGEDQWKRRDHGQRQKVADWVVGQFRVYRRRDRHLAAGGHHNRVSVRRLVFDVLDRDAAASARLVLDDHGLPDVLRQVLPDEPREEVIRQNRRSSESAYWENSPPDRLAPLPRR